MAALVWQSAAFGLVHNPWPVSEHVPNVYDMQAMHNDPRFKGLGAREFSIKFHDTFYDFRRQGYNLKDGYWFHHGAPLQEPDGISGCEALDPTKLLNVYGYGYCGIASGLLEGVYESRGLNARRWSLHGSKHSVCEVFYEGEWHYFDIDLGGWGADASGNVYGIMDIVQDIEGFIKSPTKSGYFFKADGNGAWAREYFKDSQRYTFHDTYELGHAMSITLRQGESLTRYWDARFGEFYGRKSKVPTRKGQMQIGNAILAYAPNLTDRASDFADGVYEAVGVRPSSRGLIGSGHAVFAVRLPYVITSSRVLLAASGNVQVQWSRDLGRTWTGAGSGPSVDLAGTRGLYDFLVRFRLSGGAVLEKFRIEAIAQLNPGLLPALRSGANRMRLYRGQPDETLTWIPDWSSQEKLKAGAASFKGRYRASQRWSINGAKLSGVDLTYRLRAPKGGRISRLYGYGQYRGTDGRIYLGKAVSGTPAWQAENDAKDRANQYHDHNEQRGNAWAQVDAPTALARFTGRDLWSAKIQMCYTRKTPAAAGKAALEIIHTWQAGGRPRAFTKTFRAAELAGGGTARRRPARSRYSRARRAGGRAARAAQPQSGRRLAEIPYGVSAPGLQKNLWVRMSVASYSTTGRKLPPVKLPGQRQ